MPFQVKITKTALVNPGLTESQNWSKSSQNNIFHVSTSNPSHSKIFVKFDLRLTLEGTKTPNFDPTIRMGWGIPFPRTIHGSKSELKRLRYLENHVERVSMLPEVITRPDHWNFNFFSVLQTRHPNLSKDTKISSIGVQEGLPICDRNQARKRQNC